MDVLPPEIVLHICLFLHPKDVTPLQLTSKHFYNITHDNELWREFCQEYRHSDYARKRLEIRSGPSIPIQEPRVYELQRVVAHSQTTSSSKDPGNKEPNNTRLRRTATSWDPTYPGEKIDWYNEYIARHASLSLNWLEKPFASANGTGEELESRGLGIFYDGAEQSVIAPLDDNSICIWRFGEDGLAPNSKDGRILARSGPGLLSANDANSNDIHGLDASIGSSIIPGVVECVSVDKARNKAYFAVHSMLNEVDLSTLQVSSRQRYPYAISALSETTDLAPLTVGTTRSLHLHDPRIGNNGRSSSYAHLEESIDRAPSTTNSKTRSDFTRLQSGDSTSPLNYADLGEPLPLSIIHTTNPPTIHVAGRYPSILQYDLRTFPKITSTIHSGGSLCSLTTFPTATAPTLAAAGEYHGKGSLELYPLSGTAESTRNRVSASSSKLLSITAHGTRLLFSDSGGQIKWVERDGSTLVRRWNINSYTKSTSNTTPTQGIFHNDLAEGDVARKLLPVSEKEQSEVLMWTGEKIGLLSFGVKERFGWDEDGEEGEGKAGKDGGKGKEERDYGRMMRMALERQADEVRFVRGLGLGGGGF